LHEQLTVIGVHRAVGASDVRRCAETFTETIDLVVYVGVLGWSVKTVMFHWGAEGHRKVFDLAGLIFVRKANAFTSLLIPFDLVELP
jgi:hypothetical protein